MRSPFIKGKRGGSARRDRLKVGSVTCNAQANAPILDPPSPILTNYQTRTTAGLRFGRGRRICSIPTPLLRLSPTAEWLDGFVG